MGVISTKNIKGDLTGGLTAGIVALPLALAFGIQAFGGINDPSAASMGALAGLEVICYHASMIRMTF